MLKTLLNLYTVISYLNLGCGLMKACGIIVEYNPFHHGHVHHLKASKQKTNADIVIAVMSGNFLQRGEPAIIDKFHRTKAAIQSGVDIVIELPYPYAVQSSDLFAKGAVYSLYEIGVDALCFGSESGMIEPFIQATALLNKSNDTYEHVLHRQLNQGDAFPIASSKAYDAIGLNSLNINQPNNILGLSYTKTIINHQLPIKPFTIKRIYNEYHDTSIHHSIASATSIRKEILHNGINKHIINTVPTSTLRQVQTYKDITSIWHEWEAYFPYLYYKIISTDASELRNILGVDEGIEYRIKEAAFNATTFMDLLNKTKTKRFTMTRLQRMFTHILTHTTKKEIESYNELDSVPYLRLLGMNENGRAYINQMKKHLNIPLISNLKRDLPKKLQVDERATNIYYSILPPKQRKELRRQEFLGPIFR